MPRYYFDLMEGDVLAVDQDGLELSSLRAVQAEAAKSLADMARDAVHSFPPPFGQHKMAIEVRDDMGPLLQVKFTFEVERLRA